MDFKLFLNFLDINNIFYKPNFDPVLITNIKVFKNTGKTGKIFYIWTAEKKGIEIKLNLSKKETPLTFQIFCKDCQKQIQSDIKISEIFALRNTNTLKFTDNFNVKCKKCAAKSNSINGLEKRKQTCLQKYGTEYNFNLPNFQEEAHKTKIERYGENYASLAAQKGQLTYFLRTGYTHTTQNPEAEKKRKEKYLKTISQWTPEKIKEMTSKRMESYLKEGSKGMFGGVKVKTKSIISQKFIKELKEITNWTIKEEVHTNIYPYTVDFLVGEKVIIEFYGDFWHANPEIYDADDVLNRLGNQIKTAKEIWERDEKRLQYIVEKTQLPVIIVWERDYKKNPLLTVQNLKTKIEEIILHE
jgi:hypothetical protein